MPYLVLRPPHAIDPRDCSFRNMSEFHDNLRIVMHCDTEQEAVAYVRSRGPDAVAMPVPVTVGSGEVKLLGFVADPSLLVSDQDDIPFVMFVQNTNRASGMKIPYDRKLWKVPVIRPEIYGEQEIDLRATDLEVPSFTTARVGTRDGRQVIYVEVGGIEMSLMFRDPTVRLMVDLSDPPSTTPAVGTSEEIQIVTGRDDGTATPTAPRLVHPTLPGAYNEP